jgi:ABC-type Fe3+ transport system permease subunit
MRHVTIALLSALAFGLSVYDAIAVWRGGVGASISEVSLAAGRAVPAVVLGLGIILGHLFGQPWRVRDRVADFASEHLLLVLFSGVVLGAVLWRQRP